MVPIEHHVKDIWRSFVAASTSSVAATFSAATFSGWPSSGFHNCIKHSEFSRSLPLLSVSSFMLTGQEGHRLHPLPAEGPHHQLRPHPGDCAREDSICLPHSMLTQHHTPHSPAAP